MFWYSLVYWRVFWYFLEYLDHVRLPGRASVRGGSGTLNPDPPQFGHGSRAPQRLLWPFFKRHLSALAAASLVGYRLDEHHDDLSDRIVAELRRILHARRRASQIFIIGQRFGWLGVASICQEGERRQRQQSCCFDSGS